MMDILTKHFPGISKEQAERFGRMEGLYREWNEKINLISRKDMESFYEHHVLHSLALALKYPFVSGTRIADLGTGGGFPGIPLAIMFPECTFHLVDSIAKKITAVEAIASTLGLKNVRAVRSRTEDMEGKYHFTVSRATAALGKLYKWSERILDKEDKCPFPNGMILLKGGDVSAELKELQKEYPRLTGEVTPISEFYKETYFLYKLIIYIH